MPPFECDFAILTIVDEARNAAAELFGVRPEHWEDRLGLKWGVALVNAGDGGHHIVVVGKAVDRSNVPGFEAADAMLRAWRPRHLVVADIGGGFWGEGPKGRDGLTLGDVVVASDIEYFEVEKQVKGGGTRPRRYAIQLPATGPRSAFDSMPIWKPNWYEPAQALRPTDPPGGPPKLLDGQIVSGEKLLSNPNSKLVAHLVKTYDKALGLDMESAGIGRAVLGLQREGIFAQFTVLRGVSDLFNKKDEDNQQIRDDWKPYAARVALSAAAAWIVAAPSDQSIIATGGRLPRVCNGLNLSAVTRTTTRPERVVKYLERLRAWLMNASPIAGRAFRLRLEATHHRAAVSKLPDPGATVERGEVLNLALADRKVVVVGPSGAGKSVLLRQILRQVAAQDDALVVHVDLKENWNPEWAKRLVELPDESSIDASIGALLTASALAPSASDLTAFATDRSVILIVDALNEVPADVGEKIRLALDQYVRFHESVRVLVSDRRTEQFYRESRWSVLHLSGVTDDEARHVVDEDFGDGTFDGLSTADQLLLCVPFFLDRALQSKRVKLESRASAVTEFLHDAGITQERIDPLALCAFSVYERGESVLNGQDTAALSGSGLLENLRASEIIIDGASGPIIGHQLVHQYLAGRYLGRHPEVWTPETLDKVTAQAASLDAIGMTIASITEQDERDRFLRIVFDWNWRAAVSALIETQTGDRRVSDVLATAVLAMASEKRFDAVGGTRQRVQGLLREVPGSIAERMRSIERHEQLIAEITRTDFPDIPWWTAWRRIFVRGDRTLALSEHELAAIASAEPLIGWTTANGLRRFEGTENAAALLRVIFRSQQRDDSGSATTRWRVVHAIGVWPSQVNAELLFEAFEDRYMWVVYGAVRSLVEMAAFSHNNPLRTWIIENLSERWRRLAPAPLSQLAWTAMYRDTDVEWPRAIRPLLETVRSQQTGGERERWDRRLERFETYAQDHMSRIS